MSGDAVGSGDRLSYRVDASETMVLGGRRHCVGFLGVLESPSRLMLRYELCRGSLADEVGRAGGNGASMSLDQARTEGNIHSSQEEGG